MVRLAAALLALTIMTVPALATATPAPAAPAPSTATPASAAPSTAAPSTAAPATAAPPGASATSISLGDVGSARDAATRSVRARRPFSAVGITWAHRTAAITVAVRVRKGYRWTPWRETEAAEDDRATGRGAADLVWFGPSTAVELIFTGAARDVVVDLIDPGTDPGADPSPDHTRSEKPVITSRAGWGADESQMTWPPEYAPPIKAIVWHHTATGNEYAESDVPAIMRSIYRFQAVSRGWGDIGYHVLVDRFGRLWEGRAGGLDQPVVGAHAGGFNYHTAGIAVIGDYTAAAVPQQTIEAAAAYVAWKLGPDVDPRGQTQLTGGGPLSKFPANSTITVDRVYPHRGTSDTECPGAAGMKALQPIRDRAYAIAHPAPAAPARL